MLATCETSKRYLVTGGCGFIGSHLVDGLIAKGHDVVILDDLSTGKVENANPRATLIIGDATNYDIVSRAFQDIDGCFHLAAVASVERSIVDWARTHTVNITATVNVFQAASRNHNKIPVIYTSSAAVYGDCPSTPIAEDADTRPLTAYGADKLACDLHGRVAWLVHSVPNIGLRPFNVYGPRQDPHSPYSGVISIFTDRMKRGLPITIHGDGGQVRDFVYVGDAVKTFMAAMNKLQTATNCPGYDVINLCTGRATSVINLADFIAAKTGHSADHHYAAPRKGDIRVSVGNPSRLASHLGLRLNVTLQQGLQTLIPALPGAPPMMPALQPRRGSFREKTPRQAQIISLMESRSRANAANS